jgi:hypothetical protein
MTENTNPVAAPEQPARKGKGKKVKATDGQAVADGSLTTGQPVAVAVAKPTEPATKAQRAGRTKKMAPTAKVLAKKLTSAKKPAKAGAKTAKAGGRREQLIALLSRKGGAKLTEIQKALKWQAHSVRGAISILGKDQKIESTKVDGDRIYQIVK